MSSGERPIGAAKGTQPDTEALCRPPPPPLLLPLPRVQCRACCMPRVPCMPHPLLPSPFDIVAQAEVELTRLADDLRILIETANAPIFGIDVEGRANEWNQKVCQGSAGQGEGPPV